MMSWTIHSTKVILLLAAASVASFSSGAHRTGIPPGLLPGAQNLDRVERRFMPPVDVSGLHNEDAAKKATGTPAPFRYAVGHVVNIDPGLDGTWETLADQSRLWRLRVISTGAQTLSLGLDRFHLPRGGSFWIHDPDGAWVQGPYTREDRNSKGGLSTAVVVGEEMVVELHLPAGTSRADVRIARVNHGYRGFEGFGDDSPTKRGSCSINVACPEGDRWRDQIRAVARISMTDNVFSYLCTAQLVNNTAEDDTPYLYTAGHCMNSPAEYGEVDPSTLVAYWNYQTTTCEDWSGGSLGQNQSGSTLVAQSFNSDYDPLYDFALLLLDDFPDPGFDVYYLGWDARDAIPNASTCIHHAGGEEKSISFDNDPATITSVISDESPGDGNFLRTGDWDQGSTEGGSSGACLYDDDSGLCIGSLYGGSTTCDNDGPNWFGRFNRQFTGEGTPETRLSDWLDPLATGRQFLTGRNSGLEESSSTWLVPAVASLAGAEDSNWKSQISIVNSSLSSATATVYFVESGEEWPGELLSGPHLVGPLASLYLDDPILEAGPTAGALYVTVDGSDVAAFSRTINLNEDASTFGQGMPTVLLNQASQATELILPMIHSSPGRYRTNIGFAQTSKGSYTVLLEIYSTAGSLLAQKEYQQSTAWRQVNDVFANVGIGHLDIEGGWIRATLVGGSPSFWTTYATVIDDATGDPTYVAPVALRVGRK